MKRNNKSLLICFMGMDGAGKTTQINEIISVLQQVGFNAIRVQNRFEPHITLPLIILVKKLFFKGHEFLDNYSEYLKIKKSLHQNPFLGTMYLLLVFFDYYFQTLFRVRLPLALGKAVVCDRYIHDTVVDLTVDRNYSDEKQRILLRKLMFFVPKPDLMFHIDLPEEIAFQRKNDIPSIAYLNERRELYSRIARECGMVILDGTNEIKLLKQQVINKVYSLLEITHK